MDEFLDSNDLLSGGTLFRANDRLGLDEVRDDAVRDSLARELDQFRAINRHVTSGPYLYPPERAASTNAALRKTM